MTDTFENVSLKGRVMGSKIISLAMVDKRRALADAIFDRADALAEEAGRLWEEAEALFDVAVEIEPLLCEVNAPTFACSPMEKSHSPRATNSGAQRRTSPRCTRPQIASITGHSLKTVDSILEKYLAHTRVLAGEAVALFENASSTDFANRLQTGPQSA